MTKIDTLFMTKTAEKPHPFGAAHTYIAHIIEYPPHPPGIFPNISSFSSSIYNVIVITALHSYQHLKSFLMAGNETFFFLPIP